MIMIYINGVRNNQVLHSTVMATHRRIYDDYDEFVNTIPDSFKSAIFYIWIPTDDDYYTKFNHLKNLCDKIIVIFPEMSNPICDLIKNFDLPNFEFYTCGTLHFNTLYATVGHYMSWFIEPINLYKETPLALEYSLEKKYYFDALLGINKPHRTLIHDFVVSNVPDKVFMTYFKTTPTTGNGFVTGAGYEELDLVHGEILYTGFSIKAINGHNITLSSIIPQDIYNKSAYSIVAETCHSGDFSFFTEKTCKAIAAKRLFVLFSSAYSLKGLVHLGFKTFGEIINESYDSVLDDNLRFKLACDQIQFLCNTPQQEILSLVQPIVEHNYNHLMTNNWEEPVCTAIMQLTSPAEVFN